jgi:hypothetical protein
MKNKNESNNWWFIYVLTLIFVTAKVFGHLQSWSWWQVFSPILIMTGLVIVIYGVAGIIAIIDDHKAKKASDKFFRKWRDHD